LRIVGGVYGGRKIEVSKGFNSRPTTDFAREALFNILANHMDFDSIRILDLFSGTGSISFEFASRGCTEIDLVDSNIRSVQFIAKIAADLQMKGIHPVRMDVFRFIPVCKKQYQVIFADPPYDLKGVENLPDLVFDHKLLLKEGWLILEHSKSHHFKNHPQFYEERNYGSVHFSFFRS
jgi:16S rRNA (guanine966-N2)-methyltransferase